MRGVPYNGVPDVTANSTIEWDNNKRVTYKSTLLALTTGVGQVVAIEHPDLPDLSRRAPRQPRGQQRAFPAEHLALSYREVDAAWRLVGEHPGALLRGLDVRHRSRVRSRKAWAAADAGHVLPGSVAAVGSVSGAGQRIGRALPQRIHLQPRSTFQYQGDGVLLTSAVVAGFLPVNEFVPNCGPPDVKKGNVTWSSTGGFIPGGTTLFVQICAGVVDTTVTPEVYTQWSPPSEILVLQVPAGTDTNSLTISGIKWPAVAALNGWAIFASTQEDMICGQQNDLGLPDSITLLGPIARQTYAVPDFDIDILRLRAQVLDPRRRARRRRGPRAPVPRPPLPARRRRISPARTTGRGACWRSSDARGRKRGWHRAVRALQYRVVGRRHWAIQPRPRPGGCGRAGGRYLHRLLQGHR